jgi:uncharacterized protein (UPF0333 family)
VSKKGDVKMSFGMIFSIILIIVFIAFAFYAIKKFLGVQEDVQVGQFMTRFQSDVDKIWKASQGSQVVEYALPKKINNLCFVKGESENIAFETGNNEYVEGALIKNIDVETIVGTKNKYCIETKDGKIKLTLKKTYGEALVTVK